MKIKNIFLLFIFCFTFIFCNSVFCSDDDKEQECQGHKININFTGEVISLVDDSGKIIEPYREPLILSTRSNQNITKWDTFIGQQTKRKEKGFVGEIVTRVFFEQRGYNVLEESYTSKIKKLFGEKVNNDMYEDESCTSKKGPDNGIDGIFIPAGETIKDSQVIIINEAKFRSGINNLTKDAFGFVKKGRKYDYNVQQSHSYWNRDRFDNIPCVGELKYKDRIVIRTATFLNDTGQFKLYEIEDECDNELDRGYPSSWHGNSTGRKAFNLLFQ
ncbi:MAG: hypothetical protein K0R24_2423 [Gammaproteobacteria bacterium]|jgi:hypothetical protein|nr:hypothetical protein [Gammaproteobacteria bacterium]